MTTLPQTPLKFQFLPVAAESVFEQLLEASARLHKHLCPRQVLGVRMGMLAGELLGLEVPQAKKRLVTIIETDGCFTDGVAVATNCWVGRRTMFVKDYGKIGATFLDTTTGKSFRLTPHPDARASAQQAAPDARNRWEGYLLGYQRLSDEGLFRVQDVVLNDPLKKLISRAGAKQVCAACGEEVFNEREILQEGRVYCRSCTGGGYFQPLIH